MGDDHLNYDDDDHHEAFDNCDGVDDDGIPTYSHQSYSHQVGTCHDDDGWEYDNPSSIWK